jgi:hypothetical protein
MLKEKKRERKRERERERYIQREKMIGSMCESENER